MDVATGETIDGPIDRCRFTPVAWLTSGGVTVSDFQLRTALELAHGSRDTIVGVLKSTVGPTGAQFNTPVKALKGWIFPECPFDQRQFSSSGSADTM